MKRKNWQYYLFIMSFFIIIISFLTIITKTFFKKTNYIKKINEPQKKFVRKNINELQNNFIWNKNQNGNRLFSSRNYFSKNKMLFDLLECKTSIYYPIPNQWLIDNDLDYSDPNILNKDSDGDGFTNLEEWKGDDPYESPGVYSSDPNNSKSHPLLWTKLKFNSFNKENYYFDFMGIYKDKSEEFFQLQPQSPIPDINMQGKKILSGKMKYLKLGEKITTLPLCIFSYEEKRTIYKEISYDTSELVIKNFITGECWTLIKKSTLHSETNIIPIIHAITFEYTLKSPPQKISVECGNFFELETVIPCNEEENLEKKETEVYQLIELTNKNATLKHNGKSYHFPILIN